MQRRAWLPTWNGDGGGRELLRVAVPLILSNSVWTLQIALDRIFLSRLDTAAVGAAMISALLFWTPISLLQATVSYATTFVAQYTGAGQKHRVGPAVWQALYLAGLSGVAFFLLVPLAGPITVLGGHSAALQELEAVYFRCLCVSALPTLIAAAASSFFAGRGATWTVLLINVAGLLVNGVLDYAWIFGQWGFPAWGIAGAGWATVAGTTTSAVLAVALMLRRAYRVECATWSGRALDYDLLWRLLRFGVPSGLLAGCDCLAYTVFTFLVGRLGEVELSATSIAFTINLVGILPMLGTAQGVAVLVGQRLGEDRPDLAERSTWSGLWLVWVYTAGMCLVYVLLPDLLLMVFRGDARVQDWEAVSALVPVLLWFVAIYSLFDAMNLVFSFALRGAGDTVFVTVVAVLLAWPVMVLPTWAAWHYGWGLYAAWGFASTYIMLLAVTFLLRFRHGKWRSMRVIEVTVPDPGTESVSACARGGNRERS